MFVRTVYDSATHLPKQYLAYAEGVTRTKLGSPSPYEDFQVSINLHECCPPSCIIHGSPVAISPSQLNEWRMTLNVVNSFVNEHNKHGRMIEGRLLMEVVHGEHRSLAAQRSDGDIVIARFDVGNLDYEVYRIPFMSDWHDTDPILESSDGTRNEASINFRAVLGVNPNFRISQAFWSWGLLPTSPYTWDDFNNPSQGWKANG